MIETPKHIDPQSSTAALVAWSTIVAGFLLLCVHQQLKFWPNGRESDLRSNTLGQGSSGSVQVGKCKHKIKEIGCIRVYSMCSSSVLVPVSEKHQDSRVWIWILYYSFILIYNIIHPLPSSNKRFFLHPTFNPINLRKTTFWMKVLYTYLLTIYSDFHFSISSCRKRNVTKRYVLNDSISKPPLLLRITF